MSTYKPASSSPEFELSVDIESLTGKTIKPARNMDGSPCTPTGRISEGPLTITDIEEAMKRLNMPSPRSDHAYKMLGIDFAEIEARTIAATMKTSVQGHFDNAECAAASEAVARKAFPERFRGVVRRNFPDLRPPSLRQDWVHAWLDKKDLHSCKCLGCDDPIQVKNGDLMLCEMCQYIRRNPNP